MKVDESVSQGKAYQTDNQQNIGSVFAWYDQYDVIRNYRLSNQTLGNYQTPIVTTTLVSPDICPTMPVCDEEATYERSSYGSDPSS